MNISRRLAEFVVNTGFEDIPAEVIDVEKKSILDNIAIISGGADGDGCREFVEYAEEAASGGRGEATVLGYNKKLPAIWAAFANSSMVMALDFADTSATATIHPNTSTFPVCLALSEKIGNVSGKDFLTAMIVGSEVACRIARAAAPARFAMYGFYMPPVLTSFGATAAACKLLGYNADQIIDAWSINLSQYTCSSELTKNKETPIRSIREAFGAQSAMSSALLAGKGIKGYKDPFEGEQGFYTAYFQGDYDADAVLKDLGKDFEAAKLIFKPWPCCMGNHGCINAALNIMKDNDIKPEDITAIKAEVPTVARAVLEPVEDKKRPQNAINAKYGNVLKLEIKDAYRNMKELVEPHMYLIDDAKAAFKACDVEPKVIAIRGGTDGAMLSYKGLPCPNLSTGGHNFHSNQEYIPVQSLEKMVDVLVEIARVK